MSISQVLTQTVKNNDYTTANSHILNAVQWISRDAEMAQEIENWESSPSPITSPFLTTWENHEIEVVYFVNAGGQLWRTYTVDGGAPQSLLVAQYVVIDPSASYCTWDNEELTLTLTGSIGEGTHIVNVTRLDTTAPRPKL
jgi:hypothetical protein